MSLESSAPLNLQDNKVDYRSVEISWSPPAEIYGVISKYKVLGVLLMSVYNWLIHRCIISLRVLTCHG